MAMNRTEIVQYCVNVLVACFRDRALRNGNADLAVGHLTVLLQYDWPNNASLLEEVVEKIRRQGQFAYQLFASYVIQVDILEEFAYLATDQGGAINMDIFPPSAAQLATLVTMPISEWALRFSFLQNSQYLFTMLLASVA